MEESPEAHMETDVSSTTEDVPETQEVTGSNGNVEMVVIVEKVTDDESTCNSNEQSCVQSMLTDSDMVIDRNPEAPQASPTKLISEKLPTKHTEAGKSPMTKDHSYNKEYIEENTGPASPSIFQSEETIDSLSKVDVQQSTKKSITPKKQSPVKDAYAQKTPQASPIKEQTQETEKIILKKDVTPEKPALNGDAENSNKKEAEDSSQSMPIKNVIEKEASNDSLMEANTDISEKEHNKSISRELKSLIKSAKESKIISECTQLTTKTRKSRVALDASNSSLNVSLEADKIQDARRSSINSQKSNCSEKSEKVPAKRSMRSQNPEFVNKVKQFLNSVTSKVQKESDEGTDEDIEETKVKDNKNASSPIHMYTNKKKKVVGNVDQDLNSKPKTDPYCWRCHWAIEQGTNDKTHPPLVCTICPRSFHYKCLSGAERGKINTEKSWVCPECMSILHAESSETRSPAMKKISLGALCELLTHALERMMDLNGVEPFMQPVDRNLFPDYDKYVIHPMDLTRMKSNITDGVYGSTEAFIADTQWILHNSIIFNTFQSKLTAAARTLVRSCRAEMGAIEACPECYAAAHARKPTWFTDVCSTPHMLLWAKLKGFPYWPAKGMSVNNSGLVDVRFFGAHDRAWVPAKDCFLYSEKDPNNFRTKRQDILDSMQEAEQHIRSISRKYGSFVYPPFKTQFDPSKLLEQLKMMIPSFEGEVGVPVKEKVVASPSLVKDKRSSKSSKSSLNDGDASEGEEASNVSSRKMADGAHIARIEDDAAEKDKTMEVDGKLNAEKSPEKPSRKRRRSEMEEASHIIIMESSKEKKKKVNTEADNKQDESQTPATSSKEEQQATPKEPPPVNQKTDTPAVKNKDNEPSSSTPEKEKELPKLTPIRLVISANQKRIVAKTTGRGSPKVLPIKIKQTKMDKSVVITKIKTSKDDKSKSQKRRNSKSNKSLNSSTVSEKTDKTDKKPEKTTENEKNKDKKETSTANKNKENANKSTLEKSNRSLLAINATESPKSKERIQFDDDTSLAEIARGTNKIAITYTNVPGLPTISSVMSLSTTAQSTSTTTSKSFSSAKMIEVTIEPNSNNSLLTPTSSDSVRNVKEVAKTSEISMVGRVGVRAFARMPSPELQKSKEVEVEIKAEPIDFEDQDRQLEKIDMMKAFRLRPVNQASQPASSLREVRINKVVMTPLNARKTATKAVEVRPRARKTFPQPKKPDEGRSELNSKNSMVYIPIQPPTTPGPLRVRPSVSAANGPVGVTSGTRPTAPIITTTPNNIVNTVTTPLVPSSLPLLTNVSQTSVVSSSSIASPLPLVQVGQVPTTVHRVPLITSVNGQWTFSLQPIMSVGGLDDSPTSPLLSNGLPDRANPPIVPLSTSGPSSGPTVMSASTVVPVPCPAVIVSNASSSTMSTLATLAPTSNTSPSVRVTECCTVNPGEPPRLQQRPLLMNPLDPQTPIGNVPPPSNVGPITAKLNQNAVKLTDFFRTLLEDSLEKLDDPASQLTTLRLKCEQMRWLHHQEIEEMKHNHELVLAEMRTAFEKDKVRVVAELRRVAQAELDAAIKQTKSKQWCANCNQEAQFYCCWNTSYCDYPCQRAHWAHHYAVCTQQRLGDSANNPNDAPGSRLQPQPEKLPKCTTAPSTTPTLTVGGKLAQSRAALDLPPVSKPSSSIIMSMVEDKSGNQTMKCVGVYKPPSLPAPTNQIAPIVTNNQIINNEETTANKVVTSGGYLIVGGNNTSNQVTTPPRRTHTIPYYT